MNRGMTDGGWRMTKNYCLRFVACAFLFLSSVICHLSSSFASPIVADLSNYNISMDAGFNGTKIFVFGARNDDGDVIIVVRGENKNYVVRKKEQFAGMWINRDHINFQNVPNFYAVASSKKLTDIEQASLFAELGISEKFLIPAPTDTRKIARFNEFEEAFMDFQHDQKLYSATPESISFMEETLFKTTIDFADNIPAGEYTAEIYLISDGEVVGMQSTPITVVKSGLDAFIYNFAHNSPALYGLTAIFVALVAGWFAGRLFETRA